VPRRARPAIVTVAVAGLVFASGCASKYAKVEDSFAQPINCSTAQVDIRALEEDKVSKTTEAAAGASYALPTTILMGAITGTGGATYDVGTGAYNQKIDERIDRIRSTCKVE
jgi:hypothetical protein